MCYIDNYFIELKINYILFYIWLGVFSLVGVIYLCIIKIIYILNVFIYQILEYIINVFFRLC